MNPFAIDGPALVSFSGGRTSAYMLRRILDAGLRPDVHVVFANTGKEREETLTFIEQVTAHWNVEVHWLERGRGEITAATASRLGEPFDVLIRERNFLPNPVMRFCTQELKIRVMRDWMLARGYEHWDSIIGIRHDEPRRVAKMREQNEQRSERWENVMPLNDAGVTVDDITAFWRQQPFDLALKSHEGNCDLCFMKGPRKRQQIMRDRPDLSIWWMQHEDERRATFRDDCQSYRYLAAQGDLFGDADDAMYDDGDLIACECVA
jgi:3'-phosphoadenosine 5'-phosphosulfate sulfotransferase (PAPS reductase)/FAD synthetase